MAVAILRTLECELLSLNFEAIVFFLREIPARLAADAKLAEAILAAAHAKKFAARFAERAITECIQTFGAAGLLETHGLGAHLAGAKIAGYIDGSTEIQNERIAAALLDR